MSLSKYDLKGMKRDVKRGSKEQNVEKLIDYYKRCLTSSKDLQQFWQITHGVGWLRYHIDYNVELLKHLKCENEEIITITHNISVISNGLYQGLYKQPERNQKLKEIGKECEYILKKLIEDNNHENFI